eukprot:CAMPEP_0116569888 /NCGR_PEP_ID=MMETSP0397-20121206/16605_1 /TAXON_ID=216820 /ORGANISM="Cyclophora tenuis, Strain ECT3854" /LENGTH=45 /DNA_ID= /DNA_START= /DNA_END= /DNA_ORIENTATION=
MPPFLPANVIADMMSPAETTPLKIEVMEARVGMPNKKAPIAPVQA